MDEHFHTPAAACPTTSVAKVAKREELTPRDPKFFRDKYEVEILIRHKVLSVNPATKTCGENLVTGETFTDCYDVLILSTGATSIVPPIPGVDLAHVFTLRNPLSARAIRTYIEEHQPKTAVVVGSGFIASRWSKPGRRWYPVTVVEKLPQVCPLLIRTWPPMSKRPWSRNRSRPDGCGWTEIWPGSVNLDDGSTVDADW
jgi:pyruvate/2-oxoglutarate dehydrogenase complex dihydrolipoamide dehydrogenase (E3) component